MNLKLVVDELRDEKEAEEIKKKVFRFQRAIVKDSFIVINLKGIEGGFDRRKRTHNSQCHVPQKTTAMMMMIANIVSIVCSIYCFSVYLSH